VPVYIVWPLGGLLFTHSVLPPHTSRFVSCNVSRKRKEKRSKGNSLGVGGRLIGAVSSLAHGGLAKVDADLAAVDGLAGKKLLCLAGARNVDKVSVGKASGLAGPAVNGNANVENVLDVAEKLVEVLVRHFKRHVADEEGAGRLSGLEGALFPWRAPGPGLVRVPGGAGAVELADKVAALEDLLVEVVDGSLGIGQVLEVDVTKAGQEG
jgi:hypothetical protein